VLFNILDFSLGDYCINQVDWTRSSIADRIMPNADIAISNYYHERTNLSSGNNKQKEICVVRFSIYTRINNAIILVRVMSID